jgi:hypothetical protein
MTRLADIVNWKRPGTIERCALQAGDPALDWQEWQGVWIVLVPGAALPTLAELAAWSAEFEQHQAKQAANTAIKAEIARLEAKETDRRKAEAILTEEGRAWLSANRAQIATLRAQLVA